MLATCQSTLRSFPGLLWVRTRYMQWSTSTRQSNARCVVGKSLWWPKANKVLITGKYKYDIPYVLTQWPLSHWACSRFCGTPLFVYLSFVVISDHGLVNELFVQLYVDVLAYFVQLFLLIQSVFLFIKQFNVFQLISGHCIKLGLTRWSLSLEISRNEPLGFPARWASGFSGWKSATTQVRHHTMKFSKIRKVIHVFTWASWFLVINNITNWLFGGTFLVKWRHNERDCVSDHQPQDCLLNRLFRRRSKKTSKLRVSLCVRGLHPGTGEFPAQNSYAENVSIWWRRHGKCVMVYLWQGCQYLLLYISIWNRIGFDCNLSWLFTIAFQHSTRITLTYWRVA